MGLEGRGKVIDPAIGKGESQGGDEKVALEEGDKSVEVLVPVNKPATVDARKVRNGNMECGW